VCNLSRLFRNWLDETRMKRHGNTSATNNKLSWTIVLPDRANNSPTVSGGLMNSLEKPSFGILFTTNIVNIPVNLSM
jgi:hypothetical protein